MMTGTLSRNGTRIAIDGGRLRGRELTFTAGDATYVGVVAGDVIEGTVRTGSTETRWSARRAR
jgi:hypothetical protein